MTQSEGLAGASPPVSGLTAWNPAFTPERIQELLCALTEPFSDDVVEWRVTSTARSKHGLRGQVVAYADQRAYTDRLNDLFTPLGWTRDYTVQTAQNFEVPQKGDGKSTIITAKVMVTCKVTIFGLGTHSGTGEEWATDENALTRAEAQAFKRACSCFGLGRYFYDFPRTWVDLDEQKRPRQVPPLPEWARPSYSAHEVGVKPGPVNGNGNGNGNSNQKHHSLYGAELLESLQKLSAEIGFRLTREALARVSGKRRIEQVTDIAKLTALLEKLEDLARGVRRLRAAVDRAGAQAYAAAYRELDLAGDSVDDIPSREVLRVLVQRMETLAAGITRENDGDPDRHGSACSEKGEPQ